jgi:hypothetical protein
VIELQRPALDVIERAARRGDTTSAPRSGVGDLLRMGAPP